MNSSLQSPPSGGSSGPLPGRTPMRINFILPTVNNEPGVDGLDYRAERAGNLASIHRHILHTGNSEVGKDGRAVLLIEDHEHGPQIFNHRRKSIGHPKSL